MECSRCSEPAVLRQAYSGNHLCTSHLYQSVEKRVKSRIRKDGIMDRGDRWVVGLSGGKDSSVLLHVLQRVFGDNPTVEIVAATLDEGIEGYRNEAVEASRELASQLGVEHHVFSFDDLYDVTVDEITAGDNPGKPCSYCGVFRRSALNHASEKLDATKLVMGHNLDDVAQTALMNFLDGDVERISRHYEASLSPEHDGENFVRRVKPLRDIPEKEVAVYAQLKDLPVYLDECPNAEGATRGEVRDMLLEYERRHPGTRHSIMNAYEKIATNLDHDSIDKDVSSCEKCGEPTTGAVCRKCSLLEEVKA
ncbi:MAG: TIGR00269 family protein [Halobacteria archaeon]